MHDTAAGSTRHTSLSTAGGSHFLPAEGSNVPVKEETKKTASRAGCKDLSYTKHEFSLKSDPSLKKHYFFEYKTSVQNMLH